MLLKTKGFTAAAVLTLALGMTLCTTAMVVVKVYLLSGTSVSRCRPPVPDPFRVVRHERAPGVRGARRNSLNDIIEHPIAWDLDVFYMLGGDHAESFPGAWVTSGFAEGLGYGRRWDAASTPALSHRVDRMWP